MTILSSKLQKPNGSHLKTHFKFQKIAHTTFTQCFRTNGLDPSTNFGRGRFWRPSWHVNIFRKLFFALFPNKWKIFLTKISFKNLVPFFLPEVYVSTAKLLFWWPKCCCGHVTSMRLAGVGCSVAKNGRDTLRSLSDGCNTDFYTIFYASLAMIFFKIMPQCWNQAEMYASSVSTLLVYHLSRHSQCCSV